MRAKSISALSRITFLEGLRRHSVHGLLALGVLAEIGGLFFMDFIGRDVGRACSDYSFSVMWIIGALFLFFHTVQVFAWDEGNKSIYSLLARPITRAEYVVGTTLGLCALLLLLQLSMGLISYVALIWIKSTLDAVYFPLLSVSSFILSWLGLVTMQLVILSMIVLLSSALRGSFLVMLSSISYYLICSGLPVIRETLFLQQGMENLLLTLLTAIFPNFERLDFKDLVASTNPIIDLSMIIPQFALSYSYIALCITLACIIYQKRDLY